MKKGLSMLLILSMILSLTACGGAAAKNGKKANTADAAAAKESVVVATASEPKNYFPYNPDVNTNMDDVPVLQNVYETVIKIMPDGSHEPLLAESWEISEDGLEYTLHIRDDVYFHNGKKMTAEDVAWSLNTSASTATGTTLLINYGAAEAIDENTVVVHLTSPYAPFLNSLASRVAVVADKDYLDEVGIEGYEAVPIGTGAYKYVNRISGDRVELEANEAYWGGAPAIKKITLKIMTDVNTQMMALENGEVDVLLNASIPPLLKLPEDGSLKWSSTESHMIAALNINCKKGPGADINFRRALMSGINKEEVIMGVYEGMAEPLDIYMASSFSGHPDKGTYETVPYDLEAAKAYLKASNYNGEEFMIATVSGTKNESAAQIIQGQLIELGINCSVNALDSASFFQLVNYGTGEFGAQLRATGVSVLDADGIYTIFSSDYLNKGGIYDCGRPTPELDKLIMAGRSESDPEKRKLIYTEANNYITEHAYLVDLYCDQSVVAYNEAIRGVEPRTLAGLYYFNEWN